MRALILGLGASGNKAQRANFDLSIGVNDIEKYHKVNHLIVLDPPERFSPERKKTIINSTPQLFISHIDIWQKTYGIKNFHKIQLSPYRGDIVDIEKHNVYPYSIMSPYVAIIHAYKIGAKEIVVYGVDLNDHKTLSAPNKLELILKHIYKLNQYLISKNVNLLVYNRSSALSRVLGYIENC